MIIFYSDEREEEEDHEMFEMFVLLLEIEFG